MPIFTGQIIYNLCQFDMLHFFPRKLKAFTEINNSKNIFDVSHSRNRFSCYQSITIFLHSRWGNCSIFSFLTCRNII